MRSSVFGAALAAFSVMGVGAASAATFVDPGPGFDDASFVDLLGLDVGDFAEDFVVESRGGNNGQAALGSCRFSKSSRPARS